MIRYLLDTNVVSAASKTSPDRNVAAWLAATDDAELAISVITVHELWYGVARARLARHAKAKELTKAVEAILDAYDGRTLPINAEVGRVWAELLARQNKHVNDRCLVAIAQVNGLILVTRNVKHTADLGVVVLDPFKRPAQRHPA